MPIFILTQILYVIFGPSKPVLARYPLILSATGCLAFPAGTRLKRDLFRYGIWILDPVPIPSHPETVPSGRDISRSAVASKDYGGNPNY